MRKLLFIAALLPLLGAAGWWYFREKPLPDYGPAYREYAYVSNGKSNTVSVIDMRTFELAKTIAVGAAPTGLAVNREKNEVYVVNSGSNNVSVIDTEKNALVATIGVHGLPYYIDVANDGKRAYVANSGSDNVSVIDLEKRQVVGNVHVGSKAGVARVSPDGSTVVVSNRGDNTVSILDANALRVRATLPVCRQPEDIAILPDSSKAFVACSGSSQVASIALAQNGAKSAAADRVLALMDVGKTPVSLTLKPDGGELIVCNFDADSISFIETGNDEVGNSVLVGQHPARALVTRDNSRLYTSNFGSDSVAVYDIDIGKRIVSMQVGSRPEGLALSQDERYLLVLDTQAGDVTVIQRRAPRKLEPSEYSLLTMIPVGAQPNGIVVKSFLMGGARTKLGNVRLGKAPQ